MLSASLACLLRVALHPQCMWAMAPSTGRIWQTSTSSGSRGEAGLG